MVIPEEKERGTISSGTYSRYFRAGGSPVVLLLVFLALLSGEVRPLIVMTITCIAHELCVFLVLQAGIVLADWWLSDW